MPQEEALDQTEFASDSIDPKRCHDESSRCDLSTVEIEPELFTFNESFDVNLLDINRQQLNRSPVDANLNESIAQLEDDNNEELLNNLNKLYNNNLGLDDMISILSFEAELGRGVDMSGPITATPIVTPGLTANETLTDEFVDFDIDDSDEDQHILTNGNIRSWGKGMRSVL